MVSARLVIVGGGIDASEIDLHLPARLGRGKEATVSLPHPLVSRLHCEIFEQHGQLMVRDLNSTNGTYVGSERITESVLRPGDLLTLGTVTFRALYGDVVVDSWLPPPFKDAGGTVNFRPDETEAARSLDDENRSARPRSETAETADTVAPDAVSGKATV